jgi:hypothetical protein
LGLTPCTSAFSLDLQSPAHTSSDTVPPAQSSVQERHHHWPYSRHNDLTGALGMIGLETMLDLFAFLGTLFRGK